MDFELTRVLGAVLGVIFWVFVLSWLRRRAEKRAASNRDQISQ